MKFLERLPGIIAAVCLMIVFLITSIEAVAYWTPGYYEKEYEKYQVLKDLPEMTMEDLLTVTDEMMAYLRGNREDLHVFSTIGGEHREFFNQREIAHMEDVRGLFLGGLMIRRISILLAAACIGGLFLWKGKKGAAKLLPPSLCLGTGIFFAACLLTAAVISTDFSKYFVVFHHIFFNNDLWILNPETDLLINIVPEPFFMDTAMRIGIIFAVVSLIFLAVCAFFWRRSRRKAPQ